jgi:hypothetical protein
LEEKRRWGPESLGQLLQASCPNPVGPVLVLLYLLEAHAERMGKLSLADAQRFALHTYPAADILIDPVWGSLAHETSESPLHLIYQGCA